MLPFSASQCNIKRVVFLNERELNVEIFMVILRRHEMALDLNVQTRFEHARIADIYEQQKDSPWAPKTW